MSVKGVNKKAVEHNLAFALKDAFMKNDIETLHKAAQAVFDAGYELEDMKMVPGFLSGIMNMLIQTGWSPKLEDTP